MSEMYILDDSAIFTPISRSARNEIKAGEVIRLKNGKRVVVSHVTKEKGDYIYVENGLEVHVKLADFEIEV